MICRYLYFYRVVEEYPQRQRLLGPAVGLYGIDTVTRKVEKQVKEYRARQDEIMRREKARREWAIDQHLDSDDQL